MYQAGLCGPVHICKKEYDRCSRCSAGQEGEVTANREQLCLASSGVVLRFLSSACMVLLPYGAPATQHFFLGSLCVAASCVRAADRLKFLMRAESGLYVASLPLLCVTVAPKFLTGYTPCKPLSRSGLIACQVCWLAAN